MNAADIAIGIVLIGLLAWVSIIALNQSSGNISILDLYALHEINRTLISPNDVCPAEDGFNLVKPGSIEMQPYHISAGTTDFNQTYFCFYKPVEST